MPHKRSRRRSRYCRPRPAPLPPRESPAPSPLPSSSGECGRVLKACSLPQTRAEAAAADLLRSTQQQLAQARAEADATLQAAVAAQDTKLQAAVVAQDGRLAGLEHTVNDEDAQNKGVSFLNQFKKTNNE